MSMNLCVYSSSNFGLLLLVPLQNYISFYRNHYDVMKKFPGKVLSMKVNLYNYSTKLL